MRDALITGDSGRGCFAMQVAGGLGFGLEFGLFSLSFCL